MLPRERVAEVSHRSRYVARVIRIAMGATLPLVLLIIGIAAPRHALLGAVSIVGGLAGYALRNVLSQTHLEQSEEQLRASRETLEKAAFNDTLTGVGNRRAFDRIFEREWERARRDNAPLALLLIDIDHFKQINDSFGHQKGDECLTAVAQGLAAALPRTTDFLARFGGEEFACLLPGTERDGAASVAERLRFAMKGLRIANREGRQIALTVSIGVASTQDPEVSDTASLIHVADEALYVAKRNGRNRVALSGAPVDYSQIRAS
jgi:diguanylate cyclase (GGDEF)-like protein